MTQPAAPSPRPMPPLLRHLASLTERRDRGALAELRRGLGKAPGTAVEQFPHVVPYVPSDLKPAHQWPYFLVAGLYALHPRTRADEPFGRTYRRLSDSPSRELRFRALLSAEPDEVPALLRQAVRHLASTDVPIAYAELLRDLTYWSHPDRFIQRRWARAFWTPDQAAAPGA